MMYFSFTYSAILGAVIGGQPAEPHEPQLPCARADIQFPFLILNEMSFFNITET